MIAACGMDCGVCPIRKAANDPAEAERLAEEWRGRGQKEAKAEWFRCQGCHGPDDLVWGEDCRIRQCCLKDKGLENCGSCRDFPCAHIAGFESDGNPNHKAAVERLRRMT